MTRLAVMSGMSAHTVGSLDEDEFTALAKAVREKQEYDSWNSLHEVMAACVEALWIIISRLDAGIPTVNVKQLAKPHDFGSYPRPDWIKAKRAAREDDVIVMHSVADAARMLKGDPRE